MTTVEVECPKCEGKISLNLQQRVHRREKFAAPLPPKFEPENEFTFHHCGAHLRFVPIVGGEYRAVEWPSDEEREVIGVVKKSLSSRVEAALKIEREDNSDYEGGPQYMESPFARDGIDPATIREASSLRDYILGLLDRHRFNGPRGDCDKMDEDDIASIEFEEHY